MCVICVKPKGIAMPSDELIEKMFRANPDGAGVAYTCKKSVFMKKGFMNVKSFKDFVHSISNAKDRDVVMHFRISTGGKKDDMNCHPYPLWNKNNVSGYYDSVFFHNGMLNSMGYSGNKDINDTQEFKEEVLNHLSRNFFIHHDAWSMLDDIVSNTGSKLVFLDNKYGIKIINRNAFTEKDGLLFSNMHWDFVYTPCKYSYPSYFDDENYWNQYSWYKKKDTSIADDYEYDEYVDKNLQKLEEAFDLLCDFDSDGFETYLLLFANENDYEDGVQIAKNLKGFDFTYDKSELCIYAYATDFVDDGSINLLK